MMLGYQASESEDGYDLFLGFFSIRPTDRPAFDSKRKKKKKDGPYQIKLKQNNTFL